MPFTQLILNGTPGKRLSFSAKTPADIGEHTGLFTSLSPSGTPGRRLSFSAKTPADIGEHTGLFTSLSPSGTPGRKLSFVAKEEAIVIVIPVEPEIIPVEEPPRRGGNLVHERYADQRQLLAQARREDKILLSVIKLFLREVNK